MLWRLKRLSQVKGELFLFPWYEVVQNELQDEVEILLDFLAEDESVKDELVEKLDELDQMMTSYEMTLLLWKVL